MMTDERLAEYAGVARLHTPNTYVRDMLDSLIDEVKRLREREKVLSEALRSAEGGLEHNAPTDCWATGPNTGDPILDLFVCPGCSALANIRAALVSPAHD